MAEQTSVILPEPGVSISGPWALLDRMAMKDGVDADALKTITDLVNQQQDREAKRQFAAALLACQMEMQPVIKEKQGSKGKYAPLEELQVQIGPIWRRNGFSLTWGQADCPIAGSTRVTAELLHIGGWSKEYFGDYQLDGAGSVNKETGKAGMTPLQGTVSSHTYAQRDMLRLMFNITIGGADLDGAGMGVKVGKDDIVTLNKLLDEAESLCADAEKWKGVYAAFLNYLEVKDIGELSVVGFASAVRWLTNKRLATIAVRGGKA